MSSDYWHKQNPASPLYPDLIWSRPEHKAQAGKLLIIGGHVESFAAVATAYSAAQKAGIGSVRVLLPDTLQKTVSSIFVGGEYAASTPSGSLSRTALAQALDNAAWADGVLLAGDFGRNSETAILLEQFMSRWGGLLGVTKDGLDYFTDQPAQLLAREKTVIVASLAQLQKIAVGAHWTKTFTFSMGLVQLVDRLHEFTTKYRANIIVKHLDNIFVASGSQVTTTKLEKDQDIWRVNVAAKALTWWIQNPSKPLESFTSSLVQP